MSWIGYRGLSSRDTYIIWREYVYSKRLPVQQSAIIVLVALQRFALGTTSFVESDNDDNLHNDCIAMLSGSIVTA